jgi:hypothetical protein
MFTNRHVGVLFITVLLSLATNCAHDTPAPPPAPSSVLAPASPTAGVLRYYDVRSGDPETRATIVREFRPVRATHIAPSAQVVLAGSPENVQAALDLLKYWKWTSKMAPGPSAFFS